MGRRAAHAEIVHPGPESRSPSADGRERPARSAPDGARGQTAPVKPGSSPLGRHPVGRRPVERTPERLPPPHDVEAEALVQLERARRVRGIDPQPRLLHPVVPQERERGRAQRLGDALASPRAPDRDVVEPAALDPEQLVLLGVDPVHDRPRDLVAVPRDAPQRGVGLRVLEARPEVALVRLAMAPVVAEGLVVGVEDRPVLVRRDRPQLEPDGQRVVRERAGEEPAHLEPEPDRDEALVTEQRPVRPLDVERPGAEVPLAGARIGRRLGGQAGAGRAVERGADAPVPVLRQDGAPALERERRRALDTPAERQPDHVAVQLRDQEVAADVEPRRGLVVGAERVGTEDLVHAVGAAGAVDDVGQGGPVVRDAMAEGETRDVRRVGHRRRRAGPPRRGAHQVASRVKGLR